MFKKLRGVVDNKIAAGGGIVALVVGAVATALGIDLAPTDVDVIVTAVASVAAVIPVAKRIWRKFFPKAEAPQA